MLRKSARGLLIGVVVGLCGVMLAITPAGMALEKNVGLAWLFKIRGPIEPPGVAAVVAIDGATGDTLQLPRLPRDWPRTVHADLVEALIRSDAAVIVFDMDFSRAKSGFEDSSFARAISDARRVVLFEALVGKRMPVERADGSHGGWTWVEEKRLPAPLLASAARAIGPFPLPKLGQAAFQFWAFKSSAGDAPTTAAIALQLYALPVYHRWLQVLREADAPFLDELPASEDEIREPDDLRALMALQRRIFEADPELAERVAKLLDAPDQAVGEEERRLLRALAALYAGPADRFLNFYGSPGTIETVSYQDLVSPPPEGQAVALRDGTRGAASPQLVSDGTPGAASPRLASKVVFVGYADLFDPDQPDRFYTVFTGSDGVDLSGVEIMATAFANLLTDRTIQPVDPAAAFTTLAAFGLLTGAGAYLLPAMIGVPLVVVLAAAYAVGAQALFSQADLWLPAANPFLVQLPLALLLGLMGQYLLERRHGRRMSEAISRYLPAHIIKDLTEGNVDPDSVNKVVYGTCFANDMSGFSTIAETKSPKELAAFMNLYFDALARSLKQHNVDVTEFHADTIMCAWTADAPQIAKRRDAVLAAISAVRAIEDFAAQQGSLKLNPRVGLQDGYFYLGHTGGGGRLAYSILGDTANSAARLESLNKHLGTHVLAAQSVVEGLDEVLFRPLGRFRLKGRAEATPIVQVLTLKDDASPEQAPLCALFAEALARFEAMAWEQAAALFEAVLQAYPEDGPSAFYHARCQRYTAELPDEEDPRVITMDAK